MLLDIQKLHGSVDWVQTDRDIRRIGLPFGATDITPFFSDTESLWGNCTRINDLSKCGQRLGV